MGDGTHRAFRRWATSCTSACRYVNAQTTKTTGLDLGTVYTFKLEDANRIKLGAQWSHIFNYDLSSKA